MNKKHGLFLGFAVLLAAVIFTMAGCENAANSDWTDLMVDAYTSATAQGTGAKQFLSGTDLETARDEFVSCSDDFATLAESQADGYEANPNSRVIQAMSINPDGSVSNSSVGEWKYAKGSPDTVTLQLTHGQTAVNYEERKGGTILMSSDSGFMDYYLVHVRFESITKRPFDQAAFDNGEFPKGYSGASKQLGTDTVVLNVLAIEKSTMMMF